MTTQSDLREHLIDALATERGLTDLGKSMLYGALARDVDTFLAAQDEWYRARHAEHDASEQGS